jgi:hypothetical protein
MSARRDQLPPSVLAARNARGSDRPTNGGRARAYPEGVAGEDGDTGAAAVQLVATRALLTAATPAEVAAIVATFVHDLGGGLLPARLDAGHTALPLDVSLGVSEPKLAWAEPVSVAAMRLESVLPLFVEDARVVLNRLQAEARRGARAVDQ